MKLSRYTRVEPYQIADYLSRHIKLDYSQKNSIRKCLEDSHYMLYESTKNKKTSYFMRVTIPFFGLFLLLILISMPIKWVFTGDRYFKRDGLVLIFFSKWKKMLNV